MMSASAKTPEQLIADCQGLVRSIALKVHRNLPDFLDVEDSIAYGQIGLAEIAGGFEERAEAPRDHGMLAPVMRNQ